MPILNFDTVGEGGHRLYMLHGIFGAGRNWASIARKLVRERRDWSVRLIDLRQHGASQGFPAPHTLESAAHDLDYLARELGETPAAVLGHSFGGKVALMYARTHNPEQVWLIDSTPEVRAPSGSAWEMLEVIRAAPSDYASRDELVAYLGEHGIPVPTSQWMATNLEFSDRRYRWRFDLDSIEALLQSFFRTDLWDVIESGTSDVHVVKATESSVLSAESIARVRAAEAGGRVHFHEVPGGHWLNADNPDAVVQLLVQNLS